MGRNALKDIEKPHGTSGCYRYHKCRCEICRLAHNKYMRDWRKAKPEFCKKHISTAIKKRQDFIREGKNKPCMDCKKSYPYYTMQYDHVRGKKLYAMANIHKYSFEK